ncbi:helix-turn-helix domain-containing protein [Enterococcus sp. LJL98]
MKITQLLTKNQQVQFTIFEYFLHQTTEISLKELAQSTHVSLPTLQKELAALQLELASYEENAALKKNANDAYHMNLPADFSVKGFLTHYLQQGLDYQLLQSIFYQKNISITKMMMDLQISEASIFRRFKGLNQLLKEFRIQIKNKRIVGDENQIRYFFFYFFWQSQSLEMIQKKMNPARSQPLIQILEVHFQRKFSQEEYWKLVLWFEMMTRRFDYREEHSKSLASDYLAQLDDDETFQELKNILARYLSRFAYQSFDNEAVYLYFFLLSEGYYFPLQEETKVPLLRSLHHANQKMIDLLLNDHELFPQTEAFLYALHSRVTFYHGDFEVVFPKFHRLLSDVSPERLSQCMTVIENQLTRHLTNTQWRLLDRNYGFLMELYQEEEIHKQRIGIAIGASLQTKGYLDFLQRELGLLANIEIEMAKEEVLYHLLIIDEFTNPAKYQYDATLMTTQMCTRFEMKRIQEQLNPRGLEERED